MSNLSRDQSEAQGNKFTEIHLREVHVANIFVNFFCFICSKPALTEELEMELSKEPGDQKNREYFKRQKLRSYLLERGIQIQISSDGKNKRKAEVVDLAVNAHEMKLAKVCDGESEVCLTCRRTFTFWKRSIRTVGRLLFGVACSWLQKYE